MSSAHRTILVFGLLFASVGLNLSLMYNLLRHNDSEATLKATEVRWVLENCRLVPRLDSQIFSDEVESIKSRILLKSQKDIAENATALTNLDEEIRDTIEVLELADWDYSAVDTLDILLHERRELTVSLRERLEIEFIEELADVSPHLRPALIEQFKPYISEGPGAFREGDSVICRDGY